MTCPRSTIGPRPPDIKSHFRTQEGIYKLQVCAPFGQNNNFHHTKFPAPRLTGLSLKDQHGTCDKVVFNYGRELYFLNSQELKEHEVENAFNKHTFKSFPTCHDINLLTRSKDCVHMLIGSSCGHIYLFNTIKWEVLRTFNEDYCIEALQSGVTCLKWLPGSETLFVAAYGSGNLYIFNTEQYNKLTNETAATFTLYKQGDSFNIYVCKGKAKSKVVTKWQLRCGMIHEFSFSPDCKHLAVVSQDGFLRIFDFNSQELVAVMRSYFGALLCVCWSPDGRYVVTGGEDDLVTVWSLQDHRLIARGEGHRSWVTMVAFDPWTSRGLSSNGSPIKEGEGDSVDSAELPVYRFGSVGQDAHVFLWDLCEESLQPSTWRAPSRHEDEEGGNYASQTLTSVLNSSSARRWTSKVSDCGSATLPHRNKLSKLRSYVRHSHSDSHLSDSTMPHIPYCSILDSVRVPRMYEVPRIEPLVCKRVATEHLTSILFKKECILLACNEGNIQVWARPE